MLLYGIMKESDSFKNKNTISWQKNDSDSGKRKIMQNMTKYTYN